MKKEKTNKTKKRPAVKTDIPQAMSDVEMWDTLIELYKSHFWVALTKKNGLIDSQVFGTLLSVDPSVNPTAIAKAQGIRTGVQMLKTDIEVEIERRQEANETSQG